MDDTISGAYIRIADQCLTIDEITGSTADIGHRGYQELTEHGNDRQFSIRE